ncbi:MAG: PAS domain S-box protein [Alphaproteobacteria bacterium]|nr:PAS domain S-box protein [Alphaproteobacteria bacterium]
MKTITQFSKFFMFLNPYSDSFSDSTIFEWNKKQPKMSEKKDLVVENLFYLIDSANALIFCVDSEGRISEWNRQAERITGFQKEETLGQKLVDVFVTDAYKSSIEYVFDQTLLEKEAENIEIVLQGKFGKRLDFLLNTVSRKDNFGNVTGVFGVCQDVTERKRTDVQVAQASKLAVLGEMATSVAHELKQPLNVIRMAAGNASRRIHKGAAEPGYLLEKLERISAQTERAATIIDHMQMFARKVSEIPSEVDLSDVILDALDLIGEQFRLLEIEVELNLPDQHIFVIGHKVQAEQVVLNLLTNARDALTSSHHQARIKKIWVEVKSIDDCMVQIAVEDTGGGISEGIIGSIFEPFFTTKEAGEGTGLGLSVTDSIVSQMGGSIAVSNTTQGAKFLVSLPRYDRITAAAPVTGQAG